MAAAVRPPDSTRAPTPFSARITERHRRWWRRPTPGVHPPAECTAPMPPSAGRFPGAPPTPDDLVAEGWACCPLWPRKLSNKWNSRLFAERHGVAVPELHWRGRDPDALPFAELPEAFAIRLTFGQSSTGVFVVDGRRELHRNRRHDPGWLRDELHRRLDRSGWPSLEILVEEFVRDERGRARMPVVYRHHVFGGATRLIQRARKVTPPRGLSRFVRRHGDFYTTDWEHLPETFIPNRTPVGPREPPACRDAMGADAAALGRSYGVYVGVDMHASHRGPLFGEFTPTPRRDRPFTPHGERVLGELWDRHEAAPC